MLNLRLYKEQNFPIGSGEMEIEMGERTEKEVLHFCGYSLLSTLLKLGLNLKFWL